MKFFKIDGNNIYSQFHINNLKYLIEEQLSNNLNTVVSNYYNITNGNKIYMGQTETIIKEVSENSHTIQILENGFEVDYQYIQTEPLLYNENHDDLNTYITPFASVEYKWHYQYTSNGSIKFTVEAIIAALNTAIGIAIPEAAWASSGIAYVANEIIQENIPNVWWTTDTYAYNQRCPDCPSYPDWIPAGKYRYRTQYYSNSKKQNILVLRII